MQTQPVIHHVYLHHKVALQHCPFDRMLGNMYVRNITCGDSPESVSEGIAAAL